MAQSASERGSLDYFHPAREVVVKYGISALGQWRGVSTKMCDFGLILGRAECCLEGRLDELEDLDSLNTVQAASSPEMKLLFPNSCAMHFSSYMRETRRRSCRRGRNFALV